MIRCAFFDIGNVLLFFSHEKMCRQLAGVYGCGAGQMRRLLFESGLAEDYDRGTVSTASVFGALDSALACCPDREAARTAAADIFELNESVVPIVEELKSRGLRLILLSNTCEVHSSYYLERFDVLRRFDDRVLSHEVGFRKPEEEIFRVALERAGARAEECFFVDDIAEYVEAAGRLGILSHRFESAGGLAEVLGLESLPDVPSVR